MKLPMLAVRRGPLLAMLGLLVLGLGLGQGLAAARPPGTSPGAASPPGMSPAAPPALDLTRHRGVLVEGTPGARGNLSVSCPSGQVVGGGFSHVGSNLRIIESRPDGIYAWRVSWIQTSADDSVLYAYAICMLVEG